ncbi:MAG: hypothetical protein QOI62_755 [Solirubrobacteraceae bacterium]|jgi:hypothetical protein|nr:hypothetical protein [Solirubrobacteraceae bacterium]
MSMRWVRTWLPLAIIVAGLVVAAATGFSETGLEGGALMISAGLSVWLLNLLYRVGVRGDHERDAEDSARAYYAEHGVWPDDAPPPTPPPPRAEPEHRGPPPHGGKPIDSGDGRRRRR